MLTIAPPLGRRGGPAHVGAGLEIGVEQTVPKDRIATVDHLEGEGASNIDQRPHVAKSRPGLLESLDRLVGVGQIYAGHREVGRRLGYGSMVNERNLEARRLESLSDGLAQHAQSARDDNARHRADSRDLRLPTLDERSAGLDASRPRDPPALF